MAKTSKRPPLQLTRRHLLRSAGVAAGVGVASGCKYGTQLFLLREAPQATVQQRSWGGSSVRSYRTLGRTGFKMSDISFGCGGLNDPAVARRAVERGINYFDTSPDYSHTESERALGEGIRDAKREDLFVVSKFCTADGHLASDTPVQDVVAAVEASLQRLQTDYLDLVHIHAVNSIERLMAPNIHEAFDRLKEAGKVRFLGVSSHTPDLEAVMRHAVHCGRFDVIMVAYNFKNWPDLTGIFKDAHERGVGVVAMKTLKGARHTQLADFAATERQSFAQAAFKWVLSNQDVSGLVVTVNRHEQIDEYLHAGGDQRGRRPAGKVRSPRGPRLLPPRLRRVPERLSVRRSRQRRSALLDVLGELRTGKGSDAALRPGAGSESCRSVCGLLGSVRSQLPVRFTHSRQARACRSFAAVGLKRMVVRLVVAAVLVATVAALPAKGVAAEFTQRLAERGPSTLAVGTLFTVASPLSLLLAPVRGGARQSACRLGHGAKMLVAGALAAPVGLLLSPFYFRSVPAAWMDGVVDAMQEDYCSRPCGAILP
jgi:aryl-alcohol dehydrogenase-like predicted oxidoreductase